MRSLLAIFFRTLSALVHNLPKGVQRGLGNCLGWLWFDVLRIRRNVAIDNVGIAFPELSESERTDIARDSMKNFGQTLVEYTGFPFLNEEVAKNDLVFQGRENFDRAFEQKKGVIMMTLHLGNGDFTIGSLSRLGYPINLISKEFKAKWLNDLWFGMRGKHGTRFISPEKSSFDILRALRKNEVVVFVLDQFMGPPIGVRTKFFGKETGTAMGCALMAQRTHAVVVPCYTYRLDDGRHVACFDEPIPYEDNGAKDKNIAGMTQVYTDKIESLVRQHPRQWMWIHRRWKDFRD